MATVIISLTFGLAISGAIYFIFFWPAVEPDEDGAGDTDGEDQDSVS
jgi:hypothetical protein